MEELLDFELDLQELGVTELAETAFFQLRAVADGAAKDIVELAMVNPVNRELHSQGLNSPNGPRFNRDGTPGPGHHRQNLFARLYMNVVDALRAKLGLTDSKVRDLALDGSRRARMVRDSPEDAVQFLRDYRKTLLAEERANVRPNFQLLINTPIVQQNPNLRMQLLHFHNNEEHRRIYDFLERLSPGVVKFIKSQIRSPHSVDECEAYLMMWIEAELSARAKPGSAVNAITGGVDEPLGQPGSGPQDADAVQACLLYTSPSPRD